ncbi:MAG: hypothetical protein R2991_02050 [Thermoanaerobaculia bacterium]
MLTRVERDRPHYLFIGERHAVGPVKKFTVDLVNGLVDRGLDVGLYVEGLSTRCPPRALECSRLAPLFNAEAFRSLLDESRAVVHPLDPPGSADRAASMAAEIEWGSEDVRVVLVGNTHVRFAGRPDATLPIFGGGLLYPDPGDLAEGLPLRDTLTFVLETTDDGTRRRARGVLGGRRRLRGRLRRAHAVDPDLLMASAPGRDRQANGRDPGEAASCEAS